MPLVRDRACGCAACRQLDENEPSVTAAQRAFSAAFVQWMRSNDVERRRLEPILDALGKLARRRR